MAARLLRTTLLAPVTVLSAIEARLDVVDGADHVEGRLGERIVVAGEDLLERADGLLEGHELALEAGEDLRDLEGLRHEALDLTRTLDLIMVVRIMDSLGTDMGVP